MRSEDFILHTAGLRNLGGQRVWSLMISLFGDLAQAKGDVINGPVLTTIMNLLQVKPEATRVALHRLRNDGWIISQKSGRISQHSLTPKGREECAMASPRIYARPGETDQNWQLILLEYADSKTKAKMINDGLAQLTSRVFLGSANTIQPDNALCMNGGTAPMWLRTQLEPANLRTEYAVLLKSLTNLKIILHSSSKIPPLEVAVLRCLIVHNWRRLVLRHPKLPTALLAPDWPGSLCHKLVAEMLDSFPRPKLHDINSEHSNA